MAASRDRLAVVVVGRAPDEVLFDGERGNAALVHPRDDALGLGHHLRADAVAGEQQELEGCHALQIHERLACDSFSKASILSAFSSVSPMSSRPFSRQCLRLASMSNLIVPPSGPWISCFSRSIGQRRIGAALGVVEQLVEIIRLHRHRQDAVLEAVVVENVGERRGDHAADAEVEKRPRRVLAATSRSRSCRPPPAPWRCGRRACSARNPDSRCRRRDSASRRTDPYRGRCA